MPVSAVEPNKHQPENHRPLGNESLQRKNQSASHDNNRDFLAVHQFLRTDVSPYTLVSHTSRDGGSMGHVRTFGRREHRKTIEASAKGGLHLGPVQNAMLVRFDMRWIEAVRTHFERAVARDT